MWTSLLPWDSYGDETFVHKSKSSNEGKGNGDGKAKPFIVYYILAHYHDVAAASEWCTVTFEGFSSASTFS